MERLPIRGRRGNGKDVFDLRMTCTFKSTRYNMLVYKPSNISCKIWNKVQLLKRGIENQ